MKINVEDYKTAILHTEVFTDHVLVQRKKDKKNDWYYTKVIQTWKKTRTENLLKNESLKERENLLKRLISEFALLKKETVRFFECINKYFGENPTLLDKINLLKIALLDRLESISEYSSTIKYTNIEGEPQLALKMQDYCLLIYEDSIETLKNPLAIDVYDSPLKNEFKELKTSIKKAVDFERIELINRLETSSTGREDPIKLKRSEEYKKLTWFRIGLKFATGEAQKLYDEHQNFARITTELGFKASDRPYFSESFSEVSTNSKNIFTQPVKLDLICKHCKKNEITLAPEFIKRLPPELEYS